MSLIILVGTIIVIRVLIGFIPMEFKERHKRVDFFDTIYRMIYIPFIIMFLITTGLMSTAIDEQIQIGSIQCEKYPLVAISDSTKTNVTGNYLFISMSTYTFYYQLDNGGYKEMELTIKNEDITIFETNEVTPVVIKNKKVYEIKSAFLAYFWDWSVGLHFPRYEYEIYVPEGSVVQEFDIDMS